MRITPSSEPLSADDVSSTDPQPASATLRPRMVVAARIDVLRATLCCDFMVLLCDIGSGRRIFFPPSHSYYKHIIWLTTTPRFLAPSWAYARWSKRHSEQLGRAIPRPSRVWWICSPRPG